MNRPAALVWSFGFALIITAIFGLGGAFLVGLITDIESVRATAITFLPYIVAAPLTAAAAFAFDGIYVGATRTKEMRNGMVAAVLVFGLSALLLMPLFGNHGLWLTYHLFMITRSAWLSAVYWRLERGAGFMMPAGTAMSSAKTTQET